MSLGTWVFIFICNIIIPITMIISGIMMWKHPPKNINSMIGYRTTRSMKNIDTWKFAHNYCGRLWWKMGWIMLIPSILIQIPLYGQSDTVNGIADVIICTVQCVVLIISIFPTEKALKRNFTDDGKRKESL